VAAAALGPDSVCNLGLDKVSRISAWLLLKIMVNVRYSMVVAEGRIFAGAEAARLKKVLKLLKNARGYSEVSLNL